MSTAAGTLGTVSMPPPPVDHRIEVWVRAPDATEWHLAAARSLVARCGRLMEPEGRWLWPMRGEEPGPPPTEQCVECGDAYTRETGRLTLA